MKSLAAFLWLQAGPADASPFGMLVPMLLIFVIFYFLLIRPQQRRQREQETLIKNIEKGDDVVTAGGLHGKVIGVSDDVLTLDVGAFPGERVRIKVSRSKIESGGKPKKDDAKAKKDAAS
jgi:preprotein translocase subunit YajC